jgi:HK97 family phage portal protein
MTSADLFGMIGRNVTSAGAPVTWENALRVSTVLACVRVIANGVAQVPLNLYLSDAVGRQVARNHPLQPLVHLRPNAWMTSFELRETMVTHAALTGNAFAMVLRAGRNQEIAEILPIEPGRVTVKQEDDYSITYRVQGRSGATEIVPESAMLHLRGPSWDGVAGRDAVAQAREAIGLTMALETNQAAFQRAGARTTGVYAVKSLLSPERYQKLREWFQREIGAGGDHGPMILDDGATYTPFTMSGVDQQLIETRKHQIEEICRAFGVMPIMVGHADKTATYASAEQMFLAHVVHTLDPWFQRIEQSASLALLTDEERRTGHYLKFTANALMRGAAADRAAFYVAALGTTQQPGWMTRNEVRALEELDPVEGGDAFPSLITGGDNAAD